MSYTQSYDKEINENIEEFLKSLVDGEENIFGVLILGKNNGNIIAQSHKISPENFDRLVKVMAETISKKESNN